MSAALAVSCQHDHLFIHVTVNRKYGSTQLGDKPLLRYHLLTISTLEPHPLATRIPLFSMDGSPRIRNVYQLLQIFGDILAVSATPANSVVQEDPRQEQQDRPHMVRIWNWKTGELLSVGTRNVPKVSPPMLIMLVQELVLPSAALPPAMILLDVQRFLLVGEEDNRVHLDIYGFNGLQDSSKPGIAKLLVRFSMDSYRSHPTVNLELRSILARPDPPFPSTTMQTPLGKLKPFTEDPATGLLVLSLQFVLQAGGFPIAEETVVFLLKEELLKMAKAHEAVLEVQAIERNLDEEDRIIEWDQWKHLTRVIEEPEAAPRWVRWCQTGRYCI